jgi:hypothetical protein
MAQDYNARVSKKASGVSDELRTYYITAEEKEGGVLFPPSPFVPSLYLLTKTKNCLILNIFYCTFIYTKPQNCLRTQQDRQLSLDHLIESSANAYLQIL